MRMLPLTLTIALLAAGAPACGEVLSEDPAHAHDVGPDDTDANPDPDATPEPDDLLRVERQVLTDALDRVIIAEVLTSQPVWITLYELADPGAPETPGALLATELLEAGEHTDIELRTSRNLGDGEFLLARLHLDAPADGRFGYDAESD